MGHYAPIVNLHLLLWSVPGFSFLRAPGRFTYLVVFALAGLAALGLQALADAHAGPTGGRSRWSRRPRLVLALVGSAPCVGFLAALLALLPTWRASLLADPSRARATIETTYLAVRAQYPIDPDLVSRGLLASLDLANVKTAWSLVLLALTAGLFVVWLGLGTRRAALGQALFVTLMGLDLLVFASDFHPRAPLASLASAGLPGLARGERVLLDGPGSLPDLEPDQLVAAGVAAVEGYSSLPSQRHVELLAQTRAQPTLLDLWSARYVVEPTRPIDGRVAGGVTFRVEHPLAAGFGGSRPASFRLPPGLGPAAAVRLVGTLSYAFDVPQGTTVAELSLTSAGGTAASATASGEPGAAPANVPAATPAPAPASSRSVMLPIRAGVELAERAFDRPSLHGLLAHGRPAGRTALDFEEATPEGEAYQAHLYLAELPLTQPAQLSELTIMPILPKVLVEIHGLALVSASGEVRPLGLADREGLRLVGEDERHRLIEDQAALPRAFVVPRANGVSPGRHPELTPVQIVTSPDFDPRQDVLIEGDPTAGRPTAEQAAAEQPGRQPSAAERPRAAQPVAAQVEDLGPNAVRVRAAVDRPSYLVLDDFFHRGWTARVDGQPSRVFIANALFRAVAVEPGQHVVEFRFEPLSHVVGAIISAAALILALGVVVWGAVERRGNSVPSP
jgi:hypothetical protein